MTANSDYVYLYLLMYTFTYVHVYFCTYVYVLFLRYIRYYVLVPYEVGTTNTKTLIKQTNWWEYFSEVVFLECAFEYYYKDLAS